MGLSFREIIIKIFYLFVLLKAYKFVRWLYRKTIRKRLDLIDRYGHNSWALVTGATDGIGKGFIFSLAKQGFNIILVSRSQDKLSSCANELRLAYPKIQTHTVKFDFSKNVTLESYNSEFKEVLEKFDVALLVNNVGLGAAEAFLSLSQEEIYNTAVINTLPQTMLTRLFAEKMLKREKRSGIINLSSVAAIKPIPNFGLYSATKVFDSYLSKGLAYELKHKIDILCVAPFGVESNLSKMRKSLFVISAEDCAEGSLDCLGYDNETTSHWNHDIQIFFYSLIPTEVIAAIDIRNIFKVMFLFFSKKKSD